MPREVKLLPGLFGNNEHTASLEGRQILLNEFRQIIKNKRNHSSITAFKRSWELFISDQRFQTQVTILRQEITLVDTLWGTFESASNWVLNCPVAFAIFNLAHPESPLKIFPSEAFLLAERRQLANNLGMSY